MDFIDLKAQQKRIRNQIDAAIGRVLDHSLPMHPYLDEATQDLLVEAVRGFNG